MLPFDDVPTSAPSPVWRFLWQNLAVVLFLGAAVVGMSAVYAYFTPATNAEAEFITAAGGTAPRLAPISKTVTDGVVRQRFAPSLPPITIGIIVGHRGNDSGATCEDGLTELAVNTTIAQKVFLLLTQAGINTTLLDEFDARLNQYEATLLISIHADSCVYYGDSFTGFKIAGSSRTDSAALVDCLNTNYSQTTGLTIHENTITTHMTDYHAFREIAPGTPAAIVETGFLNLNRELLTTQSDIPAQGITAGIFCFLQQ